MPKPKLDKDGKPVLDDKGQPVMEATVEEQLADANKRIEDLNKGNEARDSELKRIQALNRQLLSRIGDGNGSGMDVNKTVPIGVDFSKLDFVNDPDNAGKVLMAGIVQAVQGAISNTTSAQQQMTERRAQFYRDNPDLVGFEDIVAAQAVKIQAEGAYNEDWAGGATECAKRTRAWLKEKGFKAPDDKQPPVVLPGSNANDKKPDPAKKDETFDESKEQADALSDEIKSRSEFAGKRTTR